MKRVSAIVALCLLAGLAQGQSLEVNQAEIIRLGDMVQRVDGYRYGQAAEDAVVEAMQPPASDADKWFISVIVTKSCTACQRLKADWASDPSLLALADPNDPKRSWAHYNVYYHEDESQAWRWEDITITAYPTILVQPPRSNAYGDPATVVYQGTFDGNPRTLASEMAQAIRQYVTKLAEADGISQTAGASPPWQPAPVDEPAADSSRRLIPPLVPEDVSVEVQFPWKAILILLTAGFSIPAIGALVIWFLVYVRAQRKEADKPLLMEDETFQKLIDAIERLTTVEEPKAATTTRKRSASTKR